MNFTHSNADKAKIIKEIEHQGCNYLVTYLDGKSAQYISYDENEYEKLRNIMIDQAIERQNNIDIDDLSFKKGLSIMSSLVLLNGYIYVNGVDNSNITLLLILLLIICRYNYKENSRKLKELKKYKLFLEMIDDLDYINNSNILKSVEPENIYQIPLDINTLDRYSYSEIKTIKKELKKRK